MVAFKPNKHNDSARVRGQISTLAKYRGYFFLSQTFVNFYKDVVNISSVLEAVTSPKERSKGCGFKSQEQPMFFASGTVSLQN